MYQKKAQVPTLIIKNWFTPQKISMKIGFNKGTIDKQKQKY